MRSPLAVLVLVLHCATCPAAPVPGAGKALSPAEREALRSEALNYAQQLFNVACHVSTSYVRPVPREDLLAAALRELHETARVPVPKDLTVELRRRTADTELLDYLARVREALGPHEALAETRALLVSCQGMMKALDPHSAVVTDQDRKAQPWGDQPSGLGFDLADHLSPGPIRIARVHPGGQAQKAGLQPGDRITHVDAQPVAKMAPAKATAMLQPDSDQTTRLVMNADIDVSGILDVPSLRPVTLTVERQGEKLKKLLLTPQDERPETVLGVARRDDNRWDYWVDRQNKIAHVRINSLSRGVAGDLAGVLARLDEAGMRGLILDLRWCPGGFLDEAVNVAGLFLDEVTIATVRVRDDKENPYKNTQPTRYMKVPVIVLVNGQTSGGAELIAAALEDHKRATVAGQRTLGKGSVQTALYVHVPGASMKLTSGEFVRPSGKNLHRRPDSGLKDDWGVRPGAGLELRLSPEMDRQLRAWWERQTLRPGSSNKQLPLDDPAEDPQRQLALRGLLEGMKK